jgi:hypothetical protein
VLSYKQAKKASLGIPRLEVRQFQYFVADHTQNPAVDVPGQVNPVVLSLLFGFTVAIRCKMVFLLNGSFLFFFSVFIS